ncbi:MAG TPA: hypothetical protein VGM50_09175 [Gemmatimonadaceae bacterium]
MSPRIRMTSVSLTLRCVCAGALLAFIAVNARAQVSKTAAHSALIAKGDSLKKLATPPVALPKKQPTKVGAATSSAQPQQLPSGSTAQSPRFTATMVRQSVLQISAAKGVAAQAGKAVFRLPIVFSPTTVPSVTPVTPGPPGPPPTPGSAPVYEARFLVDSFGLPWNTKLQSFAGPLKLFIVDTLNPNAPQSPLPAAITLNLAADGASLDSSSIQIAKTNAFTTVDIATPTDGDQLQVRVTPLGLSESILVPVKISRKGLVIALDSAMPGFGFGRREAKIDMPPGFGDADSIDVGLEAANGSVSPEHVWVGPHRSGHANVQSVGLGAGSLTATAVGFNPAKTNIDFRWPIGFFIASLAGIIAGGIAVLAFRKQSPDQLSPQRVFIGGFVTGLVAAIAGSLLGVKIIGFDTGTGNGLVAVFVLAVIGSWAGPRIFALIAPGAAPSEAAKAT